MFLTVTWKYFFAPFFAVNFLGVKLTLKVYTGQKYKTYTVKSNSKGIAKLNVKSLTVGTHKVVVKSANKYCVAKAKTSTIKITK